METRWKGLSSQNFSRQQIAESGGEAHAPSIGKTWNYIRERGFILSPFSGRSATQYCSRELPSMFLDFQLFWTLSLSAHIFGIRRGQSQRTNKQRDQPWLIKSGRRNSLDGGLLIQARFRRRPIPEWHVFLSLKLWTFAGFRNREIGFGEKAFIIKEIAFVTLNPGIMLSILPSQPFWCS